MNQDKAEAYEKARAIIDDNHKQIGHDPRLLALEIDLCLIEQRFDQAIQYLVNARKEKTITDAFEYKTGKKPLSTLVSLTVLLNMIKIHLQANWQGLSRKVKQREAVLLAYCRGIG